ncbi:hypothetical protein HID58_069939 [Brassica napus]|uniref:Uncharacterized protein n=1 Tax=Brassica napus TaxID=3708 RepID=A0ABQ7YXA6_BRANA|nr:hypothetical protein HID58_069939 [Brassica napus]
MLIGSRGFHVSLVPASRSAPVDPSETTNSGGAGASGDRGASKEGASNSNDEGVSVEPSAPSPKKKKKDKKTMEKPVDEASPVLSDSLATSSEGQGTKKKKKKRARDEANSRDEETATNDAVPVEHPKKKTKKKAAGVEPGSSVVVLTPIDAVREDDATPNVPLEKKRKVLAQRSRESREKEGIEEIPKEGTPVAEEGVEKAGVEDPVVVSDSSSGEQDGEGDDDAGEISRSRPSEEDKTDDVVEGDAVSSPPGADLLTSTRPEETVAPIAEDPTEPS